MRIAMLSAHSCPVGHLGTRDTGGMSVYIRELARELGEQGHHIDVFTRVHDPRDPLSESLGHNARLVHLKVGEDEIMHKFVLYSYLPDFACELENFRKSAQLHYDLIFSHYWLSGIVGEEVGRWWDIPHAIMFHTLGAIKNSLGIGEEEPHLRIHTETELGRSCQRIIAATEQEKASLYNGYGVPEDRVGVVPCGVNLQTFHPMDRRLAREKVGLPGEKIILFAGRIEPLKGIDLLLNAYAIASQDVKARLLIIGGDAGSEPELTQLRQLAGNLGISNSVTFTGTVKHDLMPYYYNAADVCVVPSHYESFGLVALESLACGTPVVANDVGDLKHIIVPDKSGYVISDHSIEGISHGIVNVLSWPERNQASAQAIHETVGRFSWANIAEKINNEFQTLVNNYKSRRHPDLATAACSRCHHEDE